MRVQVYGCFNQLWCNGPFSVTEKTPWWWHIWRAETYKRLTNVWHVYIL